MSRPILVERVRTSLIMLRQSGSGGLLEVAAEELANRDRIDRKQARSEIEGRLTDLAEILEEKLDM